MKKYLLYVRVALISIFLVFNYAFLTAQTNRNLEGTYKRYWPIIGGGQIEQTLNLSGKSSGTYTRASVGGPAPDFRSGKWISSKIGRQKKDSMLVVILDFESKS